MVWSWVNWVLSLAPIFVARDGLSPLDSIIAALAFIRRNGSRLMAIAIWNNTLRGLAATVIAVAGAATVAMHTALPGWAVAVLVVLETLLYLVVSDFLLLVRLAAYSSVAVRELTLSQALPELPGAFRHYRGLTGQTSVESVRTAGQSKVGTAPGPSLRSGFRLAAQTPRNRLNFTARPRFCEAEVWNTRPFPPSLSWTSARNTRS